MMMWRFALLLVSLVGIPSTTDATCLTGTSQMPDGPWWLLADMSAAYLQIFRTERLACSGEVSEWRFRSSTDPTRRLMPVLSIWEEIDGHKPSFILVGTNEISPTDLISETDNWYRVRIPAENRFSVNSTGKLFMGLFYKEIADYTKLFHITYYGRFDRATDASTPNSTVVGSFDQPELSSVLRASNGVLQFDSTRMTFDSRVPLLQVRISPAGKAGPFDSTCGQPPVISNAILINSPEGNPRDVAHYLCKTNYMWSYDAKRDYTCSDQGQWEGDGYCILSYLACYYPYSPGQCYSRTLMWYYDTGDRACKLFWYGGCRGSPNRFRTYSQCMGICSRTESLQASTQATSENTADDGAQYNRNILAALFPGF